MINCAGSCWGSRERFICVSSRRQRLSFNLSPLSLSLKWQEIMLLAVTVDAGVIPPETHRAVPDGGLDRVCFSLTPLRWWTRVLWAKHWAYVLGKHCHQSGPDSRRLMQFPTLVTGSYQDPNDLIMALWWWQNLRDKALTAWGRGPEDWGPRSFRENVSLAETKRGSSHGVWT